MARSGPRLTAGALLLGLLCSVSGAPHSFTVRELYVPSRGKAVLRCTDSVLMHNEQFLWYYSSRLDTPRFLLFNVSKSEVIGPAGSSLCDRKTIIPNSSCLLIEAPREVDQGLYSCDHCVRGRCSRKINISLFILKDMSFFANSGQTVRLSCRSRKSIVLDTVRWYYSAGAGHNRTRLFNLQQWTLKPAQPLRLQMLPNSSLVIRDVSAQDTGIYTCDFCTDSVCNTIKSVSLSLKKGEEAALTPLRPLYIPAGTNFIQPCGGDVLTAVTSIKWFFQAMGEGIPTLLNFTSFANGTERMSLLPNASLLIRDVLGTDAGNYSCWRESSSDPDRQRLLSLTVCVLTVTADQVSPVSRGLQTVLNCSLLCGSTGDPAVLSWSHSNGSELEPGVETHINTSTGVTSLLRIRPTENTTLRCAVQVRGEERVSMEFTVHTHRDAALGNDTVLSNPSSDSLAPVLGALASCLSIVTILLLCFLCRRTAAKGNKNSVAESRAGSSRREESRDADADVLYAVLEIKRPVQSQASVRTEDEPVYSSVYFHAHSSAELRETVHLNTKYPQ
ncbi:carcinoembryonic antigen-related cell adhesion molecule 8 isoform X2 [Amia ocellicauda]|uniref:carcinoembryonic antigen-related cell adhesion molecule 8 isoform X2 n=1 Tax=Amia ocellicauda TaxID=2972642 RepID=UPI0034646F91